MKILLFILPALANILHGISDGAHDKSYEDTKKRKFWNNLFHYTSSASILLFIVSGALVTLYPWYFVLLNILLTRIAFFDYSNNLTQGMSLGHRGSSPIWDRFLKWAKMSEAFFVMIRLIALIFSFVVIYKWL